MALCLRAFFVMRDMIKRLLFLVLLVALVNSAQAQRYFDAEEDSVSFKDRVYFGGNFGLQLGTFTNIEVSPLVGYMVTPDFSVGMGGTFQYLKGEIFDPFLGGTFEYDTKIYGGRTFARHNIDEQFFAYTEIELINLEVPSFDENRLRREWVEGFFIGGGYTQQIFGRSSFNVMLLYNLLHDNIRSPYPNAFIVRGGFTL